MLDGSFRAPIEKVVRPVGMLLRRTGMSPDHLTILGILFAIAASVAIAQGALRGGFALVILAALPDMLDGALAKASNTASQRGAFFDSVIDRVTDSVLFGGVAWYFASEKSPHLALLPMAIMGFSSLISYERAKAEALGLYAKGGLMERAERIIAALKEAEAQGKGAASLDGKMIDAASEKMAKNLIATAAAIKASEAARKAA